MFSFIKFHDAGKRFALVLTAAFLFLNSLTCSGVWTASYNIHVHGYKPESDFKPKSDAMDKTLNAPGEVKLPGTRVSGGAEHVRTLVITYDDTGDMPYHVHFRKDLESSESDKPTGVPMTNATPVEILLDRLQNPHEIESLVSVMLNQLHSPRPDSFHPISSEPSSINRDTSPTSNASDNFSEPNHIDGNSEAIILIKEPVLSESYELPDKDRTDDSQPLNLPTAILEYPYQKNSSVTESLWSISIKDNEDVATHSDSSKFFVSFFVIWDSDNIPQALFLANDEEDYVFFGGARSQKEFAVSSPDITLEIETELAKQPDEGITISASTNPLRPAYQFKKDDAVLHEKNHPASALTPEEQLATMKIHSNGK